MPRDKKIIHRATSDIEDSDLETADIPPQSGSSSTHTQEEINHLIEERKKFLKNIILKRNLALKQHEKDKQQTKQ
jgi:hypothetical protein